jgi:putative transposase
VSETEGARFWLAVFTELQQREVQDCFVACVDGLSGLPEPLETVFRSCQVNCVTDLFSGMLAPDLPREWRIG